MSSLTDMVADFPAEHGAGADAGMRDVLRAILDDWQETLTMLVDHDVPSVQALRSASYLTVAAIGDVLGEQLHLRIDEAARAGVERRATRRGVR